MARWGTSAIRGSGETDYMTEEARRKQQAAADAAAAAKKADAGPVTPTMVDPTTGKTTVMAPYEKPTAASMRRLMRGK